MKARYPKETRLAVFSDGRCEVVVFYKQEEWVSVGQSREVPLVAAVSGFVKSYAYFVGT